MMEMLQGWLLGLTAAALAVSLLTAMLPKGETIRRIAGLAGGLILLLAVVQPLGGTDVAVRDVSAGDGPADRGVSGGLCQ